MAHYRLGQFERYVPEWAASSQRDHPHRRRPDSVIQTSCPSSIMAFSRTLTAVRSSSCLIAKEEVFAICFASGPSTRFRPCANSLNRPQRE